MMEDKKNKYQRQSEHKAKRIDSGRVAGLIKSGQTVFVGTGCGMPQTLVNALLEAEELRDITIMNISAPQGQCPIVHKLDPRQFRLKTFFGNSAIKGFVKDGTFDYIPTHLSAIPSLFYDDVLPIDVALIQVSPPDAHGYSSLGISVDCTKAAAKEAKLVIAEVNSQMPRTMGNSLIHFSQIDHFIETSNPLIRINFSGKSSPEIQAIGENVSSLIDNGATLAMGLGNIIEGVIQKLDNKKDLGFHAGMLSDGIVKLIKTGVLTNRFKTIDQGKTVASMAIGTEKLYRFIHNNPLVELHPVEYTHNINTLSKIENLTSVNAAIEVDLYGQANGEMTDGYHIGGTGGQADFIRGSKQSKGGKSIICLPSTAKNGSVSRIVSFLEGPNPVTSLRADIDFVVTEHGIAELRGKSLRQRAHALIHISHPDFRKKLFEEYSAQWPMNDH